MERSEPFIQPTLIKHFPGTVLGPGAATEVNGMNVVSPLEMLIKKVVSKAKKVIMIIMKEVSRDVMQCKCLSEACSGECSHGAVGQGSATWVTAVVRI